MKLYKILISIFLILSISIAISISPYVSTNPPQGQYHPFSEIWINESTIDWLGVSHVGLGNLIPSANVTYDIGNENLWFRKAYIKTLYVENLVGNVSGGGSSVCECDNLYVSTLYASIFRDKDNTNYYVNPAGSSKLYSLTVVSSLHTSTLYAYSFKDRADPNYYVIPSYVSKLRWVYASVFKDLDNLNYYVDPAGTSKLHALIVGESIKDYEGRSRIYFDHISGNVIIYVG